MTEPACALCTLTLWNSASLVLYIDPSGTAHHINGRAERGVEEIRCINQGDNPNVEPGGWLQINGSRVGWEPVTTVGGTLVCSGHVYDAYDQLLRGRSWR